MRQVIRSIFTMDQLAEHWNTAYASGDRRWSWFEEAATHSLELITGLVTPEASVLDVGGGASPLMDGLLAAGFHDLSVLDIAESGVGLSRRRLGARAGEVSWIVGDLFEWFPERRYDLWHDRALLHFLFDEEQRTSYRQILLEVLAPGGHVVIGAFAEDAPERCSGLPVFRQSPEQLADFLAADFEVIEQHRLIHTSPAGNDQPFNWITARRS